MTALLSQSDLFAFQLLVMLDVMFCISIACNIFNFVRHGKRFKRSVSVLAVVMLMAAGMVGIFGLGVIAGFKLFLYVYGASVLINIIHAISLHRSGGNISAAPGNQCSETASEQEIENDRTQKRQ